MIVYKVILGLQFLKIIILGFMQIIFIYLLQQNEDFKGITNEKN